VMSASISQSDELLQMLMYLFPVYSRAPAEYRMQTETPKRKVLVSWIIIGRPDERKPESE